MARQRIERDLPGNVTGLFIGFSLGPLLDLWE